MSNKRSGNITSKQKNELLDFISNHPEIVFGKFTKDFTYKTAQSLWHQLEMVLNGLPGARKDWKQWRKIWHDMKCATKSKKTQIEIHKRKTGGGPPSEETITSLDDKILSIIGPVAIHGHPGTSESEAPLIQFVNNEPLETIQTEEEISHDKIVPVSRYIIPEDHEDILISNVQIIENNKQQSSNTDKDVQKSKRPPTRIHRLENSLRDTDKLAHQTERKIDMQKDYLLKKLELYKEDIEVKKRIATALLEQFAQNMAPILR